MNLFDFHCDTLYECCETGKHLRENDLAVNRAAAQRYGHYAQVFALFCGAEAPSGVEAAGRHCLLDTPPNERFARMADVAAREFAANADWLMQCRTAADLDTAAAQGKTAALLSIEGAELLPDCDNALDLAYEAGVRILTLTWNYRSRYGCPAKLDQSEGLTDAGRALVRACEEKGILLDVSHLSERGFWDLCEVATKPFAATHSNSRKICNHFRNLTDEQFAEIVRRKGMVGINMYTPFVADKSQCFLDEVIDHIEHFYGFYGEPHLCLGCDLDGCDQLPFGVDGLADVYKLADRMLQLGYKESTVNGLFYDNLFSFMKKML